jgi:dTDP-4-dehydrorhamnose 3,5-epimerase
MKILALQSLAIPDVKVVRFARFRDDRGFFTETFRKSDLAADPDLKKYAGMTFVQGNESYSRRNVCRGLHFQWNPFMGKLVRTLSGHMIDLVLDIRKGSSTIGKIVAYDMPSSMDGAYAEWIWVPPGFAHGNFFVEDSQIEYLCSGEYSPGCEAGISPVSSDIDWSLSDSNLRELFDKVVVKEGILSQKDRDGLSLKQWLADARSDNFKYGSC